MFSYKFSEIFENTYFVEHIRAEVWMKWTKKMRLIYSQESNGKDVLFSAVSDIWTYSFSKRDCITDLFLWKMDIQKREVLALTIVKVKRKKQV